MLCELLKATGVAGCPEEFFEATRDTGLPPRPGDYLVGLPRTGAGIRDQTSTPEGPPYSSLTGLDEYRQHLARTFAWGTTPNGVFGAKLMWNQLPELQSLAGELPEFAGLSTLALLNRLFHAPRYIWVSRRDKVRQAVSLWRALQTRRWRDAGPGHQPSRLEYRFEGIHHLVRRLESEDSNWQAFFSDQGLAPLTIYYEDDLERDPGPAIRSVLAWLEVTLPAGMTPAPPLRRQADALSEDWVAAYHRDAAAASASPTGGR
jgi:LPS sulfotransferase NodH